MTKEVLKQRIKKKFGTMSNFARIVNFDRYELQKAFALKQIPTHIHKRIEELYRKHENKSTLNIDPSQLNDLKKAIEEYGGAYKFCQDFPDFNAEQVYALLRGDRKRESKLSQALFEHFEIE